MNRRRFDRHTITVPLLLAGLVATVVVANAVALALVIAEVAR